MTINEIEQSTTLFSIKTNNRCIEASIKISQTRKENHSKTRKTSKKRLLRLNLDRSGQASQNHFSLSIGKSVTFLQIRTLRNSLKSTENSPNRLSETSRDLSEGLKTSKFSAPRPLRLNSADLPRFEPIWALSSQETTFRAKIDKIDGKRPTNSQSSSRKSSRVVKDEINNNSKSYYSIKRSRLITQWCLCTGSRASDQGPTINFNNNHRVAVNFVEATSVKLLKNNKSSNNKKYWCTLWSEEAILLNINRVDALL